MKKLISLFILITNVIFLNHSYSQENLNENQLKVLLKLESSNLTVGNPIKIKLFVENQGESEIEVIRLRSRIIEHFGGCWGGWILYIDGPNGEYKMPRALSLAPPITDKDIIQLRPYESFGTIINISDAFTCKDENYFRLTDTKGNYSLKVCYDTSKCVSISKEEGKVEVSLKGIFRGPICSEILNLTLNESKK